MVSKASGIKTLAQQYDEQERAKLENPRKGPGRPTMRAEDRCIQIGLSLPIGLLRALDIEAQKAGLSRSGQICRMLKSTLPKEPANNG